MIFSLHHGWVVMSSQITPSNSPNTYHLVYIPGICTLSLSLCPSYSLPQRPHVMASHASPGDNLPECRRAVLNNAGISKIGHVKLNNLDMHQISPLFPIFWHCCTASTVILLLPKATFTPSIQPNLSLPHTI